MDKGSRAIIDTMVTFEAEVSEIIQRTRDTKSFRFKSKELIDFKAGQFFSVCIEVNGKEELKYFSFSNSPTEEGYIEFTKRITDSNFSKALESLSCGDKAKIKMPLGSFTLKDEYPKIAFLSGGIGITPIRSMCKYAADKGLPVDIVLLYGNHAERDIVFKDDFDAIASQNKNIRVAYTLTAQAADVTGWKGSVGYIDDKMIKKEIADYAQRSFYICGPPKMVSSLSSILREGLSLPQSQIITENFAGY